MNKNKFIAILLLIDKKRVLDVARTPVIELG